MEDQKHGADYRRHWRKVHFGIDAGTLEIRAIEVTNNAAGDAPMLSCLLDQIPADETVASVSGDGAYDTKGYHEAIAQRWAQAVTQLRFKTGMDLVDAAVDKASTLQVQESRLSPQLRGGDLPVTCHHLVNGGRLKWVK